MDDFVEAVRGCAAEYNEQYKPLLDARLAERAEEAARRQAADLARVRADLAAGGGGGVGQHGGEDGEEQHQQGEGEGQRRRQNGVAAAGGRAAAGGGGGGDEGLQ